MTGTPSNRISCPICGCRAEVAYTPFCSRRCADIDLGRWLNDRYVIAQEEDDDREHPQDRSDLKLGTKPT
ncbi:DNA gyrase inhibitor YacG [Methylobacterium segetis]|uniref:DNA gyrase inhibitor YacG n=1 Tax=Methylobacterium segetis TaxID=2488750 RepID=UPI00104DDE94|nr:DNA gyrase inhibitor YacG [Methylobacterium segetis]